MNNYIKVFLAGLLILGSSTVAYHYDGHDVQTQEDPTDPMHATLTVEQQRYAEFFRQHNSPAPTEMAVAITSAKPKNRPVLAAVAVVESNATPWAVGDNGDSKGSMQVQEKHWGRVPDDAIGQILQAEKILEELLVAVEQRGVLRSGKLRPALAAYNGGWKKPRKSWKYADRVVALSKSLRGKRWT